MDPVACLKCYIALTEHLRNLTLKPLFISLRAPLAAVISDTISYILEHAISRAGLKGYTA
jgi:hypothetical protein